MKTILDKIAEHKLLEIDHSKRLISNKDIKKKAADSAPPRDFSGALSQKGTRIIAEIKKASPSAGVIRPDFDPLKIAHEYEDNGAAALSVLTDSHFFQGKLEYLELIKSEVQLPLLRKDFILDEYQIHESRASGADAILLIAALLDDYQLRDFLALAQELSLAALLEVHSEAEMKRALRFFPQLIGINNRDLKTFVTDLKITENLMEAKFVQDYRKTVPASLFISESGLKDASTLQNLKQYGINAFLIGESFLREKSAGRALHNIQQAKII